MHKHIHIAFVFSLMIMNNCVLYAMSEYVLCKLREMTKISKNNSKEPRNCGKRNSSGTHPSL